MGFGLSSKPTNFPHLYIEILLFVDVLQDARLDHSMQITFHVVGHDVDVVVIVCFQHIRQPHNIRMTLKK